MPGGLSRFSSSSISGFTLARSMVLLVLVVLLILCLLVGLYRWHGLLVGRDGFAALLILVALFIGASPAGRFFYSATGHKAVL